MAAVTSFLTSERFEEICTDDRKPHFEYGFPVPDLAANRRALSIEGNYPAEAELVLSSSELFAESDRNLG